MKFPTQKKTTSEILTNTEATHLKRQVHYASPTDDPRPKKPFSTANMLTGLTLHFDNPNFAAPNILATRHLHIISQFCAYPYPPPYFAMYMQIKDLQRSVVDRYANKGLK
jgi:hypothetical protein